jgi:hypothetical protein
MSIKSDLNKQIIESHKIFYQQIDRELASKAIQLNLPYYGNLVPMFYRDFTNIADKILFVGINPSFSLKMHKGLDKDLFRYDLFSEKDKNQQKEIINNLIKIQDGLKYGDKAEIKQIGYFKCLESFSQKVGFYNNWLHYDLFPIRCTSQNLFKTVINQKELENYKSQFLDRFLTILKSNKFKAIFIFNLQSSIFIKDNIPELELVQKFAGFKNEIYGIYNLNKTPVILFKQLTGGGTKNNEKEYLYKYFSDIDNLFNN